MKKIFLFIFIILFMSVALAQVDFLGTFEKSTDINLIQVCGTCTSNNITSIMWPNSSVAITDVEMTRTGSYYNYTLDSSYTEGLGTYVVNGLGDLSGTNTAWSYTFDVSYGGKVLTQGQAILYGVLFLVLVLFFVATVFGIGMLPSSNTRDEEGRIMAISYLKYLRASLWFFAWIMLVGTFFVTSNLAFYYLQEELFARVLFALFSITLGVTPIAVIVWFAWILVKIIQDNQLKKMMERGVFGRNF